MKKIIFFFAILIINYQLSIVNCFAADSGRGQARAGAIAGGRGNSRPVGSGPAAGLVAAAVSVADVGKELAPEASAPAPAPAEPVGASCDDYEDCMDQFCLLDESEGERCACSDNIERSKSLIKKISETQANAEKLYTEGVEKEKLGAKAALVFGQSEKAKKSPVNLTAWLAAGEDEELDEDVDIGDYLYQMASKSCADRLAACGKDTELKSLVYTRKITQDCKSFTTFLGQQQKVADTNLAAAEKAVRAARFAELGNTNKYNRGECLIALRNCIAEKGGCGDNFENCLDPGLLKRRTNACENITEQCMANKEHVMKDWAEEMKSVLADAEKYADKYKRQTCLARTEACLEDKCSTGTNDACLNNVEVASGICTEITECEEIIPGFKGVINDKLGYLRVRFCQNDIESCFRDKCGADYTKPECIGKGVQEIAKLCPQDMYPSCKNQLQFNVLVSSIFLRMDYAMMQGCINQFSESLGRVCGTDMTCIPEDPAITTLKSTKEAKGLFKTAINEDGEDTGILKWKLYADTEVDKFFVDLERDSTINACAETQNPKTKVKDKESLGTSIFHTAKMIARVNAENRQYRALMSKLRELSKSEDEVEARAACELFKEDKKVASATFEPALRNCHVCRSQEVCEEGGEDKATGAMKGAAGGLAAGASAGTMVSPGWGTAIGGVVGAVGMGIMGGMSSGKKEFCQELQSCEDINM